MPTRREFMAVTAGFLSVPAWTAPIETATVPPLLDHLLLGCNDLDRGIAFVEAHTGVHAAFGGVHPGRGTRNALLSLGERRYLEIIAPDRQQADSAVVNDLRLDLNRRHLRELDEPRLVGWAAHPGNIQLLAAKLAQAGVAAEGPSPGSRKRPDGRVLHWNTLTLKDDANGLLPFFIEWSADSVHPSMDAPKGCSILDFEIVTPEPESVRKVTALAGLMVAVTSGAEPKLKATLTGPKGTLSVTG